MRRLFILLIFCTVFFTFCKKHKLFCGESVGLEASIISINIFDKVGNEYFYLETGPSPYNKDSLRVFDENGQKFGFIQFGLAEDPRNNLRRFYTVAIYPAFRLPGDEDALTREKTRTMYLRYNSSDTDTLTLVFKAKKNRCDRYIYDYLKVYYKGTLISSPLINDIGTIFQLNH